MQTKATFPYLPPLFPFRLAVVYAFEKTKNPDTTNDYGESTKSSTNNDAYGKDGVYIEHHAPPQAIPYGGLLFPAKKTSKQYYQPKWIQAG